MGVIGRWGDRQHLADRLDPIRPAVIVDERDHGLCRRSSSAWAKYADRLAQDLVGLPQLAVLPLQRLEPLALVRRRTRPDAAVALRLLHPLVQRLRRAADLARNRDDRRPARRMLALVIQHHPHRAGADLRRKLVRRLACHRSTLSGVGASDKPGAVQSCRYRKPHPRWIRRRYELP